MDVIYQCPTFTGSFNSKQDNIFYHPQSGDDNPTLSATKTGLLIKKPTRDILPRYKNNIPTIIQKQKPPKLIRPETNFHTVKNAAPHPVKSAIPSKRNITCYTVNSTQKSPTQTLKPLMMKNRTHSQQEIQFSQQQAIKTQKDEPKLEPVDLFVSFFDKNLQQSDHSTNITDSQSFNSSKLNKDSGLYLKGLRQSKEDQSGLKKLKLHNKIQSAVQPSTKNYYYRDKAAEPRENIIESLPESRSQQNSINKTNQQFIFNNPEFADNEFITQQQVEHQELSFSQVAQPSSVQTNLIGCTQIQFRKKKPNKFLSKVQSNIIKKLFDQ